MNAILDYPIRVIEHEGSVELHIPDLLIAVRGPDIQSAMKQLLERSRQLLAWAQTLDLTLELPAPSSPRPMTVANLPKVGD